MERLLHGWRAKDGGEDSSGAGDTFVDGSWAGTAGSGSRPGSRSVQARPQSSSSDTSFGERPQRRRPTTSSPRELTLESLAAMQEQDPSLKSFFKAAASQKQADGTPEMSRS